jgi:hypothetical protein
VNDEEERVFKDKVILVNDKYYIGEWSLRENTPHGYGIWFQDLFIYEGYTHMGKRVGMARNIGNEWVYEGMYANDR